MLVPGVVGNLANGATAVSPGVEVAVGRRLRYHAGVGFMHLGAFPDAVPRKTTPVCGNYNQCHDEISATGGDGVDVNAGTLGLRLPLYDGAVSIEIEPLVQLLGWTFLYGGSGMGQRLVMSWQSGLGVRGTLRFRGGYVALEPINTQIRTMLYADEVKVGFGENWPIRFSGGLTF